MYIIKKQYFMELIFFYIFHVLFVIFIGSCKGSL